MPSKSPAQAKLMRAVAHGWKMPGGGGPSPKVAKKFVAADKKAKGYQYGGLAGPISERALRLQPQQADQELTEDQKEKLYLMSQQFGSIPPTGMFSRGLHNIGQQMGDRLSGLESVGAYGGSPDQVGGYNVPRPSTRTGTDFDPDSLAAGIYEKYGIVDPTWTEYDRTSQAKLKEDPYAHMAEDDPARREYEGWDRRRSELERLGNITAYPDMPGKESEHRERLKQHKSRVADILGGSEGGAVGYQQGGLAQAMMRGRRPGGMRGMQRGRGMDPRAMRRRMPQRGPMKQLGGPGRGGRMQPGGPGGMLPGRQFLGARARPSPSPLDNQQQFSPGDARMPGGRAMPFRGFQQKQSMMNQGNLGGNRVGQSDQQGGLARALQRGTGRPPMSRRSAFPGQRQ